MMKELIQKKVLNYRKFKLHPDRLEIETKEGGKHTRYKIPIEEIGFERIYQADKNIFAKIVWYIFLAVPIFIVTLYFLIDDPETLDLTATLITAIGFGIVGMLGFLNPMQDDVILEGYRNVAFYRNRPNEEAVEAFIDEIIKTSKKYQRDKYLNLDDDITEEELLMRLRYLKDKDMISKDEFDVILESFRDQRLY